MLSRKKLNDLLSVEVKYNLNCFAIYTWDKTIKTILVFPFHLYKCNALQYCTYKHEQRGKLIKKTLLY